MQWKDSTAYFARAVIYARNMFYEINHWLEMFR
jgi:hypothetical protein